MKATLRARVGGSIAIGFGVFQCAVVSAGRSAHGPGAYPVPMAWAATPQTETGTAAAPRLSLVNARVTGTRVRTLADRAVVHATGGDLDTTPEHPFWVTGRGWTRAANLARGDTLQTPTGPARIIADTERETVPPRRVWNLTVEGVHSYFAGANSVLVHNACGTPPAAQGVLRTSEPDIWTLPDQKAGLGVDAGRTPMKLVRVDGVLTVVKKNLSADHAWAEHLSNAVYRSANVPVPETAVVTSRSGTFFTSKFIEETRGMPDRLTRAQQEALADGLAVDRILANTDLHRGNILTAPDGAFVRIDNGSGLVFSAKGKERGIQPVGYIRQVESRLTAMTEGEIAAAQRRTLERIMRARDELGGGWRRFVDHHAPGLAERYRADSAAMLERNTNALETELRLTAPVTAEPHAPVASTVRDEGGTRGSKRKWDGATPDAERRVTRRVWRARPRPNDGHSALTSP